jgi:hypothetical protein
MLKRTRAAMVLRLGYYKLQIEPADPSLIYDKENDADHYRGKDGSYH